MSIHQIWLTWTTCSSIDNRHKPLSPDSNNSPLATQEFHQPMCNSKLTTLLILYMNINYLVFNQSCMHLEYHYGKLILNSWKNICQITIMNIAQHRYNGHNVNIILTISRPLWSMGLLGCLHGLYGEGIALDYLTMHSLLEITFC